MGVAAAVGPGCLLCMAVASLQAISTPQVMLCCFSTEELVSTVT